LEGGCKEGEGESEWNGKGRGRVRNCGKGGEKLGNEEIYFTGESFVCFHVLFVCCFLVVPCLF